MHIDNTVISLPYPDLASITFKSGEPINFSTLNSKLTKLLENDEYLYDLNTGITNIGVKNYKLLNSNNISSIQAEDILIWEQYDKDDEFIYPDVLNKKHINILAPIIPPGIEFSLDNYGPPTGVPVFYSIDEDIPQTDNSYDMLKTTVRYVDGSLSSFLIDGEISGLGDRFPTNQIPNIKNAININLGTAITSIGEWTFNICEHLEKIEIPNTVTRIGKYAFMGCTKLLRVKIPQSVTHIDYGAFSYCKNLSYIDLPNSLSAIESGTFYDCGRTMYGVYLDIPEGISEIKSSAFFGCLLLKKLTLPTTLTKIDYGAFGLEYSWWGEKLPILFKGKPPVIGIYEENPSIEAIRTDNTSAYYTEEYKEEWEAVIDAEGKWQGIPVYLAETTTEDTPPEEPPVEDNTNDNIMSYNAVLKKIFDKHLDLKAGENPTSCNVVRYDAMHFASLNRHQYYSDLYNAGYRWGQILMDEDSIENLSAITKNISTPIIKFSENYSTIQNVRDTYGVVTNNALNQYVLNDSTTRLMNSYTTGTWTRKIGNNLITTGGITQIIPEFNTSSVITDTSTFVVSSFDDNENVITTPSSTTITDDINILTYNNRIDFPFEFSKCLNVIANPYNNTPADEVLTKTDTIFACPINVTHIDNKGFNFILKPSYLENNNFELSSSKNISEFNIIWKAEGFIANDK